MQAGGFDKNLKMAGDYYLWKKFSNYSKLYTCNINIGVQRKWEGQMQKDLKYYYHEIGITKCIFKFLKYFRLFYSIALLPYTYFQR